MNRAFIVREDCGRVRTGRINDTGTIAPLPESKDCGTCGGTSFRISEESADSERFSVRVTVTGETLATRI